MTDAEEAQADALDEEYTKNPPAPGPNGTGAWSKWRRNVAHIIAIDDASATYLRCKAFATHKTPTELVSEMIQKEIAATS
jgi:hypothetical protein